jgi:hypothetical protein
MNDKPPKAKTKRGRPPKEKPPKVGDQEAERLRAAAEAGAAAGKDGPEPDGDTPPKPESGKARQPRSKRITKKGTEAIRDAFAELLSLPAVPCAIAGDQWAAQHFSQTGPRFAEQIAAASERNPVLRRWCERMMAGETTAVLLMAAIAYAGPPLIHWNLVPVPEGLLPEVPRARKARRPTPQGSPADANLWPDRPEPQPEPAPDLDPQVDPADFGDGPMGAVFHGADNGGEPPTYDEEPIG